MWPEQACAYKMGELKIEELREQVETTLGKFTYSNGNRLVCHVASTGFCILNGRDQDKKVKETRGDNSW